MWCNVVYFNYKIIAFSVQRAIKILLILEGEQDRNRSKFFNNNAFDYKNINK